MFGASHFAVEERDGTTLLTATRAKLRDGDADMLAKALLAPGDRARPIVLDLSGVDFLSTAVMSVLTRVATEHRLRLVGVSAQLDHLLGMLGVRGFFHRCDTVEAALADLAARS